MDDTTAALVTWGACSTIMAVQFFVFWRQERCTANEFRDGWRRCIDLVRKRDAAQEEWLKARDERVAAEALLVDALRQGAKPEAKA